MLFNLTRSRHFPSKKGGEDIYCNLNYGPCFTGTMFGSELAASREPYNGTNNCEANKGYTGY